MKTRETLLVALLASALATAPGAAQTVALSSQSLAFVALAGGANPSAQTVSLRSTTGPALTWRITSAAPAWLTVSPLSGAAPATLSFAVDMSGLRAGVYRAIVVIASNDPISPVKNITVTLAVVAPGPGEAAYEVELRFTGYTGLVTGYPNCAVNPQGFDALTGIVTGRESVGRDEDVEYRGTLIRSTLIDFCETKGRRNPNDDERVWCAATLLGAATMRAQLTVYGETGRGAYLKATHDGGPSVSSVTGTCEAADMTQWQTDYPRADDGGGGSPNGQEIDDASSKLFAAGQARLVVGVFPPSGPTGGWTLKVIRKLK
jgi:hypothetical protein